MDIKKALEVATAAHHGQTDKVGVPYIQHPMAVAALVSGDEEKIVALLHDVVEDTDMTLKTLKNYGFSEKIIDAIDAITKRDAESFEDYLSRVKSNKLALAVKFADITHNTSPERYGKLPKETQNRLRKKYSDALEFLRSK